MKTRGGWEAIRPGGQAGLPGACAHSHAPEAVEDHQQDSWPGLCAEDSLRASLEDWLKRTGFGCIFCPCQEYKALGAAKEVPRMRQSDLRDPEDRLVIVSHGAHGHSSNRRELKRYPPNHTPDALFEGTSLR